MKTERQAGIYPLCVVGVGNTLAGDDGAGNTVVSRLRKRYSDRDDVLLHNLETDPLELWDVLPAAERFIFVDALAGQPAGRLVCAGRNSARRAWSPSLHQMDLPTVVFSLCTLLEIDDLSWSIWGVTIDPPEMLVEGFTPEVAAAVEDLVEILSNRIESEEHSVEAPAHFQRIDSKNELKGPLDGC